MRVRASAQRALLVLALLGAGCNVVLGIGDLPGHDDAGGRDASVDAASDGSVAESGADSAPGVDGPFDATALDTSIAADSGTQPPSDAAAEACSEASALCKCADLNNDPRNCGSCGHDCEQGTCEFGQCQPFVLVPNIGGGIYALATNGTDVIYLAGSGVFACSEDSQPLQQDAVARRQQRRLDERPRRGGRQGLLVRRVE